MKEDAPAVRPILSQLTPSMPYDPEKHHRRNIRLPGYDYRQPGAYFISIVTEQRACVFGWIDKAGLHLNAAGKIIEQTWFSLETRFPTVRLDTYVIMPNHFHGIIFLNTNEDDLQGPALGDVVGAFKSLSNRAMITAVRQNLVPQFPGKLWQINYHERILRDENEYQSRLTYIADNPANWLTDEEYRAD